MPTNLPIPSFPPVVLWNPISKIVVPRTCIASNKALSFVFDGSRELELENGVWSDGQVVLDGGRWPVWKYSRTAFAVQREGDDQEVCYQDESVSSFRQDE